MGQGTPKISSSGWLVLVTAVTGAGLWLVFAPPARENISGRGGGLPPQGPTARPPANPEGEPLPAGAVARLGTLRFRHGDMVSSMAFTPDGRSLITISPGRPTGVRVFDAADGKAQRQFKGRIYQSFAVSADSRTMALATWEGLAQLLDMATGQETRSFAVPRGTELITLSPDGRTLATWAISDGDPSSPGGGNVVSLYDVAGGKLVRRLERKHDQAVVGDIRVRRSSDNTDIKFLAFTPDGKAVVSGSWDKAACLWDVQTGSVVRLLGGMSRPAHCFALSPDGKALAAAGDDGALRLYDLGTGRELLAIPGTGPRIQALAFAPDGQLLAAACTVQEGQHWFSAVNVWEVPSGRRVSQTPFCPAQAMAFSPDRSTLATCGWEGTVRLWQPRTGQESRPDGGHRGLVLGLAFAPGGRTLVSESDDRTVRWWDLATGKQTQQGDGSCAGLHACLALSPDGRLLAAMRADEDSITLRDAATGGEIRQLRGHQGLVYAVAFSADGKALVSAERDGPMIVWDVAAGQVSRRFRHAFVDGGQTVALSRDGALLAVAKDYHTSGFAGPHELGVWETATGRRVGTFWLRTRQPPARMVFSPDRKTLITGTYDGTICMLDVATGKEKLRFQAHEHAIGCLAISPDGEVLASSGTSWDGNTIRLWGARSGKEISRFPAHGYQLYALAFSPDSTLLASGGADTTIVLWDVPAHQP
jgi:WD40 repeat protein